MRFRSQNDAFEALQRHIENNDHLYHTWLTYELLYQATKHTLSLSQQEYIRYVETLLCIPSYRYYKQIKETDEDS